MENGNDDDDIKNIYSRNWNDATWHQNIYIYMQNKQITRTLNKRKKNSMFDIEQKKTEEKNVYTDAAETKSKNKKQKWFRLENFKISLYRRSYIHTRLERPSQQCNKLN